MIRTVHLLLLLLLLFFSVQLAASDLGNRLRLLFPGEEPAVVSEREFLGKQLENIFRQLKYQDRLERRSVKKQVDRITDRFKQQVFRTYDPAAELTDAFRSGRYNDATASVLVSLTLEKFNIPHEGYVDHWESYLLVDPQGKRLIVRNPAARPHDPEAERSFRREYLSLVRTMVDQDLTALTPAEADSVFYQYYYRPNHRLTFLQLSAYEQFRLAQSAYIMADYRATARHISTALLRDSRMAFMVLDQAAKVQASSLKRPNEADYARRLFVGWRGDPDNRYYAAALLRHFDERQQALLSADRPGAADTLITVYLANSPQGATEWQNEVRTLQQLRLLAYHQEKNEIDRALELAEELYAGNPESQQYRNYIAELTLVYLRDTYSDPEELLRQVERKVGRYPFIKEHDRYADIILRQQALRVRDRFAATEIVEALGALAEFRQLLVTVPGGLDRKLWTLTAFVAASNYYFAEREYVPARAYIEEALLHDPTNDFLLHQQDLLSRY
ncbi:hypothetical protein GGR28_000029 [Lewinella aquimaris]|uniref:Uncharacterized protein n=1 Tax=Neolewinella aquimaris TaxID=1835722 RepID=A0A840E5M8_9BACT|nr:hypothetical protein [Neolewinella aquimaris]MBB4077428.1 hypothetical protein [Neolewinella aquimaris]